MRIAQVVGASIAVVALDERLASPDDDEALDVPAGRDTGDRFLKSRVQHGIHGSGSIEYAGDTVAAFLS
jgi:hypothetical protein